MPSSLHDPQTLQAPSRGARSGGRPTKSQTAQLSEDLRERALDLFLELGYDGTSVAAIARAAGTTKAAVYGRFTDKKAIFEAAVGWAIGRSDWPTPAPPLPDVDDLEGSLRSIAEVALQRATHPSMISLTRTVAAQAGTFPKLANSTFAASWSRKAFVVLLLQHHAASGAIVAAEPEVLADSFLALVAAAPAYRASLGMLADASTQPGYIDGVIRLFLSGIRPR
jgi:AcrR family transcriptional regulator